MKEIKIEPLPLEYRKNGYTYKQVKRTAKVAMYTGGDEEDGVQFVEVIVIRTMMNKRFGDKIYPPCEILVGNNEFGSLGFCYGLFEGKGMKLAEKRYQDMVSGKFFAESKREVEVEVVEDETE